MPVYIEIGRMLSIPLYGIVFAFFMSLAIPRRALSIPLYGIRGGMGLHGVQGGGAFYSLIWDFRKFSAPVHPRMYFIFLFPYMGFFWAYRILENVGNDLSIPLYGIRTYA